MTRYNGTDGEQAIDQETNIAIFLMIVFNSL